MTEFKRYRRTQVAEMADWEPGMDMAGVSISEEDRKAGSPKSGDSEPPVVSIGGVPGGKPAVRQRDPQQVFAPLKPVLAADWEHLDGAPIERGEQQWCTWMAREPAATSATIAFEVIVGSFDTNQDWRVDARGRRPLDMLICSWDGSA